MTRPTLTILVPAFNEERRLPALLERLRSDADAAARGARLELAEIIVVDDGSTDATAQLLAAEDRAHVSLRVITLPRNLGKGAAVKAGMRAARGDVVLMTDVDLSTPLEDLARLSAAIDRGADMAIGSRSIAGSDVRVHQPVHRELMGKIFNLLLRILSGLPWRDTQCGFKLFRRQRTQILFELQRVDRFAFDAELCVNARRASLSVVEVPVHWTDHPDSRVGMVGSSLQMALDLVRIGWLAHQTLPTVTTAPAREETAL
jgi:dolichyl-phosphate beta-glucosyltransferase